MAEQGISFTRALSSLPIVLSCSKEADTNNAPRSHGGLGSAGSLARMMQEGISIRSPLFPNPEGWDDCMYRTWTSDGGG